LRIARSATIVRSDEPEVLMRVLRSLALAALSAFTLASCSMFGGPTPNNVPPTLPKPLDNKTSLPFPSGRTFSAISYKDQAFNGDRPTIMISDNYRGIGFSACNNWSATIIPRADQRMQIGPVAVSKRKCEDRLMHNEQVFLFVLHTTQEWFYDGYTLTLRGPFGEMKFQPAA
jgi:heat shock protein HslJ